MVCNTRAYILALMYGAPFRAAFSGVRYMWILRTDERDWRAVLHITGFAPGAFLAGCDLFRNLFR